ncbi:MAG: hypothetical protein ACTS46_00255 [Candidatus Hodgkinia cicadicola]
MLQTEWGIGKLNKLNWQNNLCKVWTKWSSVWCERLMECKFSVEWNMFVREILNDYVERTTGIVN